MSELIGLDKAMADIRLKRQRQVVAHGWTRQHDDERAAGELAQAAMVHLQTAYREQFHLDDSEAMIWWPWDMEPGEDLQRHFLTQPKREALVNAAALLVAEIERLDRSGK